MRGRHRFAPATTLAVAGVTEKMWEVDTYADRDGYQPGFIDAARPLALPGAGAWAGDLVALKPEAHRDGDDPHELKYRHFSVVMAASRGQPLFSAVNIDGSQSNRDVPRTNVWRRDPRIPANVQNLREAYGHAHQGFFSRGHMTRREDPNWGSEADAIQADADTFHVTNVAPQQQDFNGGIWLDLEDYVLDNTDESNLRVTVITGPVMRDDDPVYYNIRIPVDFWKIVVFTHAVSKELTAIGYMRSQVDHLPRLARGRFVFGNFEDTQVSIAGIAKETGLALDDYIALDVMEGADDRMSVKLRSLSDLYLRR